MSAIERDILELKFNAKPRVLELTLYENTCSCDSEYFIYNGMPGNAEHQIAVDNFRRILEELHEWSIIKRPHGWHYYLFSMQRLTIGERLKSSDFMDKVGDHANSIIAATFINYTAMKDMKDWSDIGRHNGKTAYYLAA